MTILLHAAVVAVLLQFQPVRSAITNAVPIMVSLITPPAVDKPKEPPKPLPGKPRVQRVEPRPEPPPLMTAMTEIPPPPTAPASQPEPPPAPPAPPAPVVAAPGPATPVVPPSFNAAYLNNPAPAYPAVSRRTGQQGKVVLRVLVNTLGTPDQVEIRSSSGHDRLDDAALEAVRRWRFVPARQGDRPVAAWVLVPITFTIES